MATKDIILSIGGDTKDLKRSLRSASKDVRKFTNDSTKKYGKYAAAATAAGAAVTIAFVKKGLEAVDAQAKLAKQIESTSSEVATLTRAGELAGVSLSQITNASLKLSINAGKAEQGLMAQKRSFDAMGISAKEVMALPLSERFIAINKAINENVEVTQRAAVASDLFGAKNASLIALLDGGTISKAAKEMEILGLNISEIDAAKVEQANDAMSTMGKAVEGISQQLAVQFAPILQQIGTDFLGAAEDAGGMGNVVDGVMKSMVKSIGFVLDAIHGIKVIFQGVSAGLIISMNKVASVWADRIQFLLELANNIPNVDFSGAIANIQSFSSEQKAIMTMAKDDLDAILNAPMPSDSLDKFVAKAEETALEAAKKAAEARKSVMDSNTGGSGGNVVDFDSAKLDKLRAQNATEHELLLEKLELERETLDEARANGILKDEEWNALQLAAKQNYEDGLTSIEKSASDERARLAEQEARNRRDVMQGMMSNLTSLMNSGSKKQFEIGKKAALASAAINGIESAISAFKAGMSVGGPAAPVVAAAYMASSIASTGAKISAIRSQSFGGGGSSAGQAGAAASAGGTAQTIPQQEQQSSNMFVRGINPNQMFSGQQLVDIINTAQDQGAVLRVGT